MRIWIFWNWIVTREKDLIILNFHPLRQVHRAVLEDRWRLTYYRHDRVRLRRWRFPRDGPGAVVDYGIIA